jgi:hypothetical protein
MGRTSRVWDWCRFPAFHSATVQPEEIPDKIDGLGSVLYFVTVDEPTGWVSSSRPSDLTRPYATTGTGLGRSVTLNWACSSSAASR